MSIVSISRAKEIIQVKCNDSSNVLTNASNRMVYGVMGGIKGLSRGLGLTTLMSKTMKKLSFDSLAETGEEEEQILMN